MSLSISLSIPPQDNHETTQKGAPQAPIFYIDLTIGLTLTVDLTINLFIDPTIDLAIDVTIDLAIDLTTGQP